MGGVVLGIQCMGKLLCVVDRGWQIEVCGRQIEVCGRQIEVCGRKCEVSGSKEEGIGRVIFVRG
jgi:hypothetical protein